MAKISRGLETGAMGMYARQVATLLAYRFAAKLRSYTPVRTSALARSIQVQTGGGGCVVSIGEGIGYAMPVEGGVLGRTYTYNLPGGHIYRGVGAHMMSKALAETQKQAFSLDTAGGVLYGILSGMAATKLANVAGAFISPKQIAAGKGFAAGIGEGAFFFGSRQTGKSVHTGQPPTGKSDLDVGIVGGPSEFMKGISGDWGKIPGVEHAPTAVMSREEAVKRGYYVMGGSK